MTTVFTRKASYDYDTLKPVVFDLLDSTIPGLIKQNSRVLIKPNLLLPAAPEKGILTHPMIVRAAVEYVLKKEGIPLVADSPAMGSFDKIITMGGFRDAFTDLPVEVREFKQSIKVDTGEPFGRIDIAEDAVNADVIINLPKLKTHTQMLLTMGIKNMFGCVVGLKKPEWHFKTGIDRSMFARLLVAIYKTLKPAVTLVDGILALEGQGPGKRGTPRELGILIAGKNAAAVDMTICSMLGIPPEKLATNMEAKHIGLADGQLYIQGDFPLISGFAIPELSPLTFGPEPVHKIMRRHLLQRPVVDRQICDVCAKCWQYCPAKAIYRNTRQITFDYNRCIRCYCCIEICPQGAIYATEPISGKILKILRVLES